jgi:hypothetical protein
MSSTFTALKLINSLSGSEKRHFKLFSGKQQGEKDYLGLFEIIEQNPVIDTQHIAAAYQEKFPGSSLDNASRYLIKLVTDSLIQAKVEKDNLFHLLQRLMRVKILQERSLTDEAYHELKKIRKKAELTQNHFIQYITFRYELNHLSDVNFPGISDTYLVEMQMKAKESLRTLHHIEGHYSLYELLKYRLIHYRGVESDEDKKKLNDLLLSEVSLVAGKVKNKFEFRKLHLMFQSFFFTHTGNHKSALKTFHELNTLFEQNADLQEHPPIDYFTSLDGILDSLNSNQNYEQMPFYIDKIRNIDIISCPDHFRSLLEKTIVIYTLRLMLEQQQYGNAILYIKSLDSQLLEAYHLINVEKRLELYLYCSLAYFGNGEYKKALKYLNDIIAESSRYALLPVYKALRLLHIMIHYELKNTTFLTYEIRSYKRFFHHNNKTLKSEKLIFKTIHLDPFENSTAKNKALAHKIKIYCKLILEDKYERVLLKYIDLPTWALNKFKVTMDKKGDM